MQPSNLIIAQALSRASCRRTQFNLVAIVVGGLYNPFYSAVLEQFTTKFQAAGHRDSSVHAPK